MCSMHGDGPAIGQGHRVRIVMGLPDGETFDFLGGRVLEQVCFGQFQVQLRFDERVTIAVEGAMGVSADGAAETTAEDPRNAGMALIALLGRTISQVRLPDAKNLVIEFDDGATVRVIDSEERYESFQVHVGDCVIVV